MPEPFYGQQSRQNNLHGQGIVSSSGGGARGGGYEATSGEPLVSSSSSRGSRGEWCVMNIDYLIDKLSGEDGHLKDMPPLLRREMREVDGADVKPSNVVRLLTWNMLADALSQTDDCSYSKCPPDALRWETRRFRLLEEILTYKPDIVCLQECDHYDDFFAPGLGSVSYLGTFVPKPKAYNIFSRGIPTPDGCCICYREDRFRAVKTETLSLETADSKETNQVAIFTIFRLLSPNQATNSTPDKADIVTKGREFCVVTTHLKSGEGFEDMRSHQAKHMLSEIKSKVGSNVPLIICGDFNSKPDEEAYKAMTSSELKLSSAYTKLSSDKHTEPPYTTWKVRVENEKEVTIQRTVDYIWYSSDKLAVKALLPAPTEEQLGETKAPSKTYPSDHFSLVADLYFK